MYKENSVFYIENLVRNNIITIEQLEELCEKLKRLKIKPLYIIENVKLTSQVNNIID